MVLRILSSLKDAARLQRRMHNKMLVADNAAAITGGRNLGETYFGQSEGTNFVDIDVLAAGRIARDLSRSFDQYWNNPLAYPVQSLMSAKEIEMLKPKPAAKPEGAQAAYDRLAPGFEALSSRERRDWQRFYDAVKRLARLPQNERHAIVNTNILETPHG